MNNHRSLLKTSLLMLATVLGTGLTWSAHADQVQPTTPTTSAVTTTSNQSAVAVQPSPAQTSRNGFTTTAGKSYYYNQAGQLVRNQLTYYQGHYYYLGNDGARYQNQFLTSRQLPTANGGLTNTNADHVYYFDPQNGQMWQNRFYQNWGHMYYFGPNGARYTNQWYQNWGHRYYFGNGGVRVNGTGYDGPHLAYRTIGGNVYGFNRDGIAYTGFLKSWGHMYYFDPQGARYTNCWYTNWGQYYYFGNDGVRYDNRFLTSRLVPNNRSGFTTTNQNHIYYFDPSTGMMWRNRFYHNWGYWYYYGNDGALMTHNFTLGRASYTANAQGVISSVFNNCAIVGQNPELPTGCEITAVTMMLQYAGKPVNKIQLANEMPRSNDGNRGFVGNPFSVTGWWVFPTGVAPVVNRWIGHSRIMTGASLLALQSQLLIRHLVVVWQANMNGFVNHAVTLTGFNNQGFYYNNPWTARKEFMTYGQFYYHWNRDAQRALSY